MTTTTMTTTAYERLLDALRTAGSRVVQRGESAMAQCPGHDDNNPSLSVRAGEGRVLLYCHAGCEPATITAAIGWTARDLFDQPTGVTYDYRTADGLTTLRTVTRTPDKRFRQAGQTKGTSPLYRLPEVTAAVAAGEPVYLVEGEQDADTARLMGATGTTAPGGATNFHLADVEPLRGARVVAVVDRDAAGKKWAGLVADKLAGVAAEVLFTEAATGKDLTDHYAAGKALADLVPVQAAEGPSEGAERPVGASWAPVDLDGIIDALQAGTLTRPEPTVGRLEGGGALFYPGRVNGLAGESGGGKTWAALACVGQELSAGNGVVYIDLEDDAAGIVSRLLDLDVDAAAIRTRFAYLHPDERLDSVSREQVELLLDSLAPSLVVIDSTGEALALDGAKPNADEEVAGWFRRLPRPIADRGPAVVILDHVTKADGEGLWPIGSQRKRAAITGAQYMQRVVKPFSRDTAGLAKLVCAKDRSGNYRAGQHVADLRVTPAGDGVALALVAAVERDTSQPFRPTALMERVSKALEVTTEPLSFRGIDRAVQGKADGKRQALAVLVAEGYVSVKPGPRGSNLHRSVREYRQDADPESDTFTGGTHSTASTVEIERVSVSRPRDGDGTHTLNRFPGHGGDTVGDSHTLDGITTPPEPVRAPPRPTPADGSTCVECGELLTDPGALTRCRPHHGNPS